MTAAPLQGAAEVWIALLCAPPLDSQPRPRPRPPEASAAAVPTSRERSITHTGHGHGHVTGRWPRSCPRLAPGPRAALFPAPSLESSRLAGAGVKVQAGCSGRFADAMTLVPQTPRPTFPASCCLVAVVPRPSGPLGAGGWARAWLGVSLASRRPPRPVVGPQDTPSGLCGCPGGAEPPAASVQPAFAWAAETAWPLPGATAQSHLRQRPGSFAVFTASAPILPGRAPFLEVDRRRGRLRPGRHVNVAAESHWALDRTCFMRPRGPSVGGKVGDPAILSISWSCGFWGPRPVRRGGNRGTGAAVTYLCPSCLPAPQVTRQRVSPPVTPPGHSQAGQAVAPQEARNRDRPDGLSKIRMRGAGERSCAGSTFWRKPRSKLHKSFGQTSPLVRGS